MNTVYDFRIDAWKPETLPMTRLAEYLAGLAALFGNKEHVHFHKIRRGSAIPEIVVDEAAVAAVNERLSLVGAANAPADLARASSELNRMLRDDNATGTLKFKGGAKILDFPGRKTQLAEEAVVYEFGELDGVVIRVGGKDETVPVTLEGPDGVYCRCNAGREIARKLAAHIFGQALRVAGRGKWRRSQEGNWELESFDIRDFEPLDETPLETVVAKLRAVEGSDWNGIENPQAEFRRLRRKN